MLLKPGKLVRAHCKGEQIGFTLDEPAQGTLAVKFISGSAGAQSYCFEFGGTVLKDTRATNPRTGVFQARDAAPPAACPIE